MERTNLHPASRPAPSAATGSAARIAVWVVLGLVALHTAAVALWVAPANTLKDRVGYERLRSYVLPMFDQAWSVFAPEADNAYDLFEIRGTLTDGSGRERQTEWIKVTAREVRPQLRYHAFPSRTALITDRLASDQLRLFNGLTEAQKQVVHDSGVEVPTPELAEKLLAVSTNDVERDEAAAYARTEVACERFLSGIAEAVWGEEVVAVQYRQNQVYVPTYQQSQGSDQVTSGYSFTSNVRPLVRLTGAERHAFGAYVEKWDIR